MNCSDPYEFDPKLADEEFKRLMEQMGAVTEACDLSDGDPGDEDGR